MKNFAPARTVLFAASGLLLTGASDAISQFDSLIKAGQYTEASSSLETYTKAHPDSWQALYQLGYVQFRLHRIQLSLTSLSKCLVLNEHFSDAHKILALDLNILGRKDLAISELEKAIASDPNSYESYYELGRIYYDQGSYLNSVKELERAKALEPGFVKVYHNLGLAYSAVGNDQKAIENFEGGLRLNQKQGQPSSWPLIDYASYFNLQGQFDRAKAMLLEAIRINDTWDQEFDELSKAYRGLGETDLAIQSLKRAIAINPRKAEYHYILSRLYSQSHQMAEAKQELSEYDKIHQATQQR